MENDKTALCFPGQGPQDSDLIKQLVTFPAYKDFEDLTQQVLAFSLEDIHDLDEPAQLARLRQNEIASLITVLHSLLSLEALEGNIGCDFLTGYSVGQYVALYAAGCFGHKELLSLIWNRCLLMNEANRQSPGKMAAVIGLPLEAVQSLCYEYGLWISNYNARGQYTLAGAEDKLQQAVKISLEQGAHKSQIINVEGAWHSPHMKAAAEPFGALLAEIKIHPPQIPVIDNVTGAFLPPEEDAIKAQLVKHLFRPVLWEQGIRHLMEEGGGQFIEVGYGNMLSKFGFFISRDAKFMTANQALKRQSCVA